MAKGKGKGTNSGDAPSDNEDDGMESFAVVAKKSMMRGGRAWTAGVHVFDTPEKIAELGTPEEVEAMLAKLELYPDDFEVKRARLLPQSQSEQANGPSDPPPQT